MDIYIVNNYYLINFEDHEIKNLKNGIKKALGGLSEAFLKLLIENRNTTIKYGNIINDICPLNESKNDKQPLYDARDELKNIIKDIDSDIDFNEWIKTYYNEGYKFIANVEVQHSTQEDTELEINIGILYTLLYGEGSDKNMLLCRLSNKANYKKEIPSKCFTKTCYNKLTKLEFLESVLPTEMISFIYDFTSKQIEQLGNGKGILPSSLQQNIYNDIKNNELRITDIIKKCRRETENNLFNIETILSCILSIINYDGSNRRLFDCYHRCTDGGFVYRGLAVLLIYALIGKNRFEQLVSKDTDYKLFIE